MTIVQLAEDVKLKLFLLQACCYCGSQKLLAADHLISTKRGGENKGQNLIWVCRYCSSSKGAKDMLEWLTEKWQFPPLLLLRRYLKLAIELCQEKGIMETELSNAPELPISLTAIPISYPQHNQLKLWTIKLI